MNKVRILILSVLLFGFICMTCEIDSVQASVEQANQSVIAQSLRDPIQITTNEQFDTLGFPGSGTSEDPYRIENLHFILNDTFWTQIAIAISGTNKSFEISDCIFEGFIEDFGDWTDVGGTGVKLILAKNGVISNCEFKTLREGVSLEGSEDIVIEECSFTSTYSMEAEHGPPEGTVTEYAGSSIKIDSFDDGSTDVMVKDCDMTHFGAGVETSGGSSNISIIRNSIVECNVGIHPQRSQFVEISNNTCLYNVYEGIAIHQTNNSTISWNNCSFNTRVGIGMDEISTNNVITNNTVQSNGNETLFASYSLAQDVVYSGIWIAQGSTDNEVLFNDFIDNGMNAKNDVSGNYYDKNFYSDYSGSDINNDLIGDTPHGIPGDAPTQDNHPRLIRLIFESPDDVTTTTETTTTTSTSNTTTSSQPLGTEMILIIAGVGVAGVAVVIVFVVKSKK